MGITDRNETATSPSGLIWEAAGKPPHKYAEEAHGGPCATCGSPTERGVPTEQVNNPTFANHAEFFRYGTHVCQACAWLYGDPKRTHRNVLAVGDKLWWPKISREPDEDSRPSWLALLSTLSRMPKETPAAGVLTADPKPRNWPRMRLASAGSFGLYFHAASNPSLDVSEWRTLDPGVLLETCSLILEAQIAGFSRYAKPAKNLIPGPICVSLYRDQKLFNEAPKATMELEERLRKVRGLPEFLPAVVISGITKEEKNAGRKSDVQSSGTRLVDKSVGAREARDKDHKDGDRLF